MFMVTLFCAFAYDAYLLRISLSVQKEVGSNAKFYFMFQ